MAPEERKTSGKTVFNIQELENEVDLLFNEVSDSENQTKNPLKSLSIHHIIIDCSPINYIDSVGVKALIEVNNIDYKYNISLFYSFFLFKAYKRIQ